MTLPAGKFDGIETLPLFDLPANAGTKTDGEPTKRSVSCPARAACPQCKNVSVGLDAVSGHFRYRDHIISRTYGATTTCSASGQFVHDLPPRGGEIVVAKPRDGGPHRRAAYCGCEPRRP